VLMAAFLVEVFFLPGRFASFCLFALALGPMCCFWRPRFDCGFVWKKQSFKFPFPFPLSLSLSLSLLRLLFRSLSCAVAAFCSPLGDFKFFAVFGLRATWLYGCMAIWRYGYMHMESSLLPRRPVVPRLICPTRLLVGAVVQSLK